MKLYPTITGFFFIWFFVLMFIMYFGFNVISNVKYQDKSFLESLSNWDGEHFIGIAEKGYTEKFQYAFFPLYPLLINLVNTFTQNYLYSALAISGLFTFLGMHLFYNLVSLDFSKKLAEKAVTYLLLFPTAFYLVTVYSEGLFFFLTIATFLFARKNNLILATLFASLAGATRIVGLAVILGFLVNVQLTTGFNRKSWFVFLSFSGFLAYCFFLFQQTGDPFYFITAEKHWLRTLSLPGMGFWETIRSISTPGFIEKNFTALFDLIFAIFGLGLVIRSFRFLPPFYSVFGLISILIPLFTPSLSSMPRFLLPIFPIFILLGLFENHYMIFFVSTISILLLGLFAVLFINGYWIS